MLGAVVLAGGALGANGGMVVTVSGAAVAGVAPAAFAVVSVGPAACATATVSAA